MHRRRGSRPRAGGSSGARHAEGPRGHLESLREPQELVAGLPAVHPRKRTPAAPAAPVAPVPATVAEQARQKQVPGRPVSRARREEARLR